MTLRNTSDSYGKLTRLIHWLMAILIIGMIIVGLTVDFFEKDTKMLLINLHKATGFLLLLLALFRWFWTLTSPSVKPLPTFTKKEIGLSHAVKWSLMLLLIVMPVSGWLLSMYAGYGIDVYGLFEIPSWVEKSKESRHFYHEMHEIGGNIIIALLGLHVLAALKHHYINKDKTLTRMLGK